MPLVGFRELMADAARGRYAVGYFESWNLESLLAVADAAESQRSPVILGFSGVYLPDPTRLAPDHLADYAALAGTVARRLSVPCCLLFNESPYLPAVHEAVELGFDLVMYCDENLSTDQLAQRVRQVVRAARRFGCCVEGEPTPLPGVGGELRHAPQDRRCTDVAEAARFVQETDVDALAVNIGQVHLHGRGFAPLDFRLLEQLQEAVSVPLVLHGASSIRPDDIRRAIECGVRKINVGSTLKQTFLAGVKEALTATADDANPYDVLGSGKVGDILTAGRIAMSRRVAELMLLFGSAARAERGGSET